jgi:hypothetical protein
MDWITGRETAPAPSGPGRAPDPSPQWEQSGKEEETMLTLRQSDSIAAALVKAIRTGNLESLLRLLAENPGLAVARIHDK